MVLYLVQLTPHFDQVSGKTMDGSNVIRHKVSFLAILGLFSNKRAPGDAMRIIFKNLRMLHVPLYKVVTPCNISEKYNGQSLSIFGAHARTDAQMRLNYKVPIRLKSGDQKRSYCEFQVYIRSVSM